MISNKSRRTEMRYALGIKLLISFIVGGIAVLYKLNVNPKNNQSEISRVINVPRYFLFNLVTKTQHVPAYFSWISQLREMDPRKNLTVGKQYRGIINMPFLGQHDIRFRVVEVNLGHWLVLKPDETFGTYLNSEVILMLNSVTKTETQFHMKIIYHRPSALFQMTLGAFLKRVTDQQLRRAALSVQTLAMSKWNQWRNSSGGGHSSSNKKTPKIDSNTSRKFTFGSPPQDLKLNQPDVDPKPTTTTSTTTASKSSKDSRDAMTKIEM